MYTPGSPDAACGLYGPSQKSANRDPRRNPAKRLRWGEEEQRNERAFAAGGSEGYGACSDEGKQSARPTLSDAHSPGVSPMPPFYRTTQEV